jgi:hypothetical protein
MCFETLYLGRTVYLVMAVDYEGLREEKEGPMERENNVRETRQERTRQERDTAGERHDRRETSHERDSSEEKLH